MIYLLVGDIQTGKSSALMRWVKGKRQIFGVISPIGPDKKRFFFEIQTQRRIIMQAETNDANTISVGRYHFFNSAFKKANAILQQNAKEENNGYIIVDELGKLELKNQGLDVSVREVIKRTRQDSQLHAILVVRTSLISAIRNHYNILDAKELTTTSLLQLQ